MKQFPSQPYELTSAKLIRDTIGNFYLNVTIYVGKQQKHINKNLENTNKAFKKDTVIGIDFGIKNQLTLSNGISFKYKTAITPKLKKLQRKLSKQEGHKKNEKKSKNFIKTLNKVKHSPINWGAFKTKF